MTVVCVLRLASSHINTEALGHLRRAALARKRATAKKTSPPRASRSAAMPAPPASPRQVVCVVCEDSLSVPLGAAHSTAPAFAAMVAPAFGRNLMTEPELDRLLVEWNDTTAPFPDCCLNELIEAQTRRTPDEVAVRSGDRVLTYAELDRRANQLAHRLAELGVGTEVLVAICVERSVEMVVGLLGILKAGGAYVPIDPGYPADRQEYMLTDSHAPVVVTEDRLRAGLPLGGAAVVCIDRDWPAISRMPIETLSVNASPAHLAYVIYTSGSTGQPKGVQITHRSLVNFLIAMRESPGQSSEDVLVAVTTLSFDIAGLELYLPLICGARVVIASAEDASSNCQMLWIWQ
jgi:non-ribosomal peptide synthetase component F